MTSEKTSITVEEDSLDVPTTSQVSGSSPKEKIVQVWYLAIALSSLVAVNVSLFELYFNSTLCIVLFMRYSLDAFFILNIISRFYIGFEKHGVVITDLQQVRRAYLKTWFIVDLFSVLPLETLKFAFPSLHFLHFNRCLRVLRLFNIISYFSNEPETNKIYVEILKSFAIVVICVQFSACIWFNQACVAVYDGRPRHCPIIQNWLTLLPETNLTETTDLQYYSVALYWSIITFTTVGYGDIYAKNTDEAVIAVVVMVIGMVVFHGIVLSGMSSIIANLDSRRGRFCRRIKAICLHMKKTELPEDIQMQVLKSYRYLWKTQKDMNVVEMFDDLPLALHLDVSSARFKTLMTHCPFLKGTDDIFRRALSLKFKTQTFSPGHILARPGDIHTNVYYIEHGQVEVFGDQNAKIDTLLPGSLFGELSLLHKIPRNVTVRTATLCEITVLESKDLHDLFDDYPAARDMMMDVARNRLQNTELPIQEVFAPRVASEPHDVVSVNRKCFWKNTIYPDSAFAKIWTEVVLWSIIFSVFIHIWVLFFTNNDETVGFYYEDWGAFFLVMCCLVDFVAGVDILVKLFTGVITKDGYLSALPKIFERYKASRNLYYDVLAIVPFELLALTEDGTDRWRFFGYCRCNRLIWIRKIYLYFHEKENDVEQNTLKQRAVKCFLLLLFSVHCCSGVLYISACTIFRCDENSWAWNAGLKATMSNFYHYIIAAYFSTTTMTTTGYGDIVPTRMSERVASTVVAFVGLFVFNYIVSQSYAALSSENAARVAFQDLLSSMSLFMEQHDLSISLKNRVIEYMSLLWTNYQGQAHPRGPFLMHDLPVGIRQTILMKERGELLSKVAFFEPAGKAFIGHLASSSMLYYFPRGEIIQYRKTISRELFCVRQGVCQVLCDDLSEIVETFGEGMYFGEAGFLYARPALMTVRAETCCEILVIDFEKVKPILERYPALKSQIEKFQTNLQYYDNLVQERDKIMSRICENVDEPGVSQEKDDSFEQTPCSRKSKCYIEDFGNFPIYAGAEEETKQETTERRVLPQRPRTVKGQLENFFTSVFLMRNVILPSNPIYRKWECFRIFVAIAISVISSLLFAFLHSRTELWIVSYILLFPCWIDIYLRLNVALYKDNCLTSDTLETSKHYLKTGFLLDFISCFPWEILCMMSSLKNGFSGNSEVLHLYAYMRAPHVLQLCRVPSAFSHWESGIATKKTKLIVLKFFLYGMLSLHFTACIVFASVCPIGDIYSDTSNYLFPGIKHNYTEFSWVSRVDFSLNYDTVTFSELYAISLYFATATFCVVGFGDIYPYLTSTVRNFYGKKIINIFIMIAGVLYYGWLSGASAAMLGSADARRTTFTKKIESMKMFLKSMGITGDLYKKTLQFYVFTWIRTKGIDQHTLFEYLPLSLVGDISTIIYAEVIAKAFGLKIKKPLRTQSVDQELSPLERKLSGKLDQPFFQKTLRRESMEQLESDGGFIRMLARHVRPRLYRVSDVICRHKEYGSEMYFINKGEVDVLAHDEQKVIIKLRAGQYFGECSLLYAEPRAATIRAATNCDLHVLSKKSLDEIVKHYPDVCEQIRRAAEDERSASTERDKEYTKMSEDAMAEEQENETLFRRVLDNILRIHDTTISPENTAYIIYQYLSCLLIIISFWAITCMPLVFDLDRDIFLFTMIIEYIQMIEIILKFHIGYYDDSGSYISDYKSVFWKYMTRKVGFVYDVICSIPYGFLVLHKMHEMAPITFLPLFLYVRTGHLLRIVTVVVFMRREEQLITTSLMRIRIIKSLVTTLLFVHCAAVCCVAFVTYFGTQSWVKTFDMHSYPDIYRYAVYWTLTTYTTTGYGDVVPQMFREVIFVIFLMILSKMQVIYNTGLLSSTQTNHKLLQVAYEDKLQTLQTYMMNQKIPSSIQNHVIQFYNYKWARTKGIDFETLFKDLPPCMKIEILSKITMKFFLKHRLFTHLSEPFLQHLSAKMVFRSYIAGQCISRRGDREDGMHLIISGKVEHSCSTAPNKDIRYHYAGHFLGVDLLLTPGVCRNTAIAHTYVDTFFLSKASFDEVVSYYPEDWIKLSRGSLSAPCNSRPASQ